MRFPSNRKNDIQSNITEYEFVDYVIENIQEFKESCFLPEILLIEKEKCLSMAGLKSSSFERKRLCGRIDILLTHANNKLTIFEAKVPRNIGDGLSQGLTQLLIYKEILIRSGSAKEEDIMLVLVTNKIIPSYLESLLERYNLDIILAEFNDKSMTTFRPRKFMS